jgi:hypothetical protein
MKFLHVKWADVDTMCTELAEEVRKSNFKPDIIIGIARGGWVPARLLSDKLHHPEVASMRVEFYVEPGVTEKVPRLTQAPCVELRAKKVLLVDDVSDTGHSLALAVRSLKGAKEVRTATLHFKPNSIFEPDYYVAKTDKWIVYPWEVEETKKKLGKKQLF